MIKYVIKRLLIMIPILLGICFIVQLLISVTPGDPARIIAGADREEWEYEQIREELGLNDPLLVRFGRFLGGVVQGDLGTSFKTHRSVGADIKERFPYTLMIATLSVVLAVAIGIPLGVYAANHQYSWRDNATIFLSLICTSMPAFWFALLLVQYFSVKLGWLPVSGVMQWQGWILPVVSNALGFAAQVARQMRSNMLEVIRQDYIVTARAKGQAEGTVLYRHALKNALIPVIQTVGGMYGMSLGGALIAEMIFSVPGLGSYTLVGLTNRDYPIIQGSVLFLSAIFCVVILLIDIIFAFIDPRIRSQYVRKRSRANVKGALQSAEKV
ncbi:MAG: ABC transporter permease [Oscillospiraceae bacterium]|jgi:peptide/nickel transport system permease protein|nr:ABC transporter permease [Oscillospiraceae bacterium]